MNYFELFGLPKAPVVDRTELARKYFELQKQSHPDFYTQSSDMEKNNMLERSATINKAFQVFSDKDKTLEYYLTIQGAIGPDEKFTLPPDFLMEVMEINETIASGKEADIRKTIAGFEESLAEEAGAYLHSGLTDPGPEVLASLKSYYYKKKYLHRILDRFDD